MLPMFRLAAALALALLALSGAVRAEPGVTATAIRLGMSAPFHGPAARYGKELRSGAEALFRAVNDQGGVFGRRIELVTLDDGNEADRCAANTRTLIEEKKVFALFGYFGAAATAEALKQAVPARVPLIGAATGAALQAADNRYVFTLRAGYERETGVIMEQLASLGMQRIAVLYQDDEFGKAALQGARAALARRGLAPVATAPLAHNSLAVGEAARTIGAASPQAVLLAALAKPAAEFVRALRRARQDPQFATLSPVGADFLAQELGSEARGISVTEVIPSPTSITLPAAKEYRTALFQLRADAEPTYYGMEGFLAAKLAVAALRQAGKAPTREALVNALQGSFDLGGFTVNYSAGERDSGRPVELTVIGPDGQVLR